MEAMTYSQARQNFTATMNKVCDDHMPVILTRQKERAVVMMSLEDYNSIQETLYLMKSPNNHMRLLKSIENAKQGKTIQFL
ncbi:MAG: type II toxin-antitoxin system prevent-host-death family antitoxin [Pseudomonadota bacterium]